MDIERLMERPPPDPGFAGLSGGLNAIGMGRPTFGHLGALGGANLPPLPPGYVFYVDLDGKFLVDSNGNFYIGPA